MTHDRDAWPEPRLINGIYRLVEPSPTVCEVCGNLANGEPGRCYKHFRHFDAEAGALDAAWAAAEAALPEGWWVEKVYLRERGTALETFSAWARRPDSSGGLRGDGETPEAALRALATTLADAPSVRGRVTDRRLDQRLKANRAALADTPASEPRP